MSEIEDTYSSSVYPKRPVEIVKGKGARVWDSEGKEYIDCVSGIGVALIGHSNDVVINAINEQAKKIMTNHGIFYSDVRAQLLQKLAEITPEELTRTFLSNSGTESIECAIKISRKFTGKKRIMAMKKGFHGRTYGSLSATWNPKFKKGFEPLVPDFDYATFNDLENVKEKAKDVAAIILEPVQGESGVIPATKEFMKGVRDLCDDNQILLILDEIQTGLGRTGRLFAFEHYGVTPDILCLAKGIAGGLPMGATIAKSEIFEALNSGDHGSTLGGNPLSCATALATIDYIIQNNLPEKSAKMGRYFLDRIRKIESNTIKEIRGIGLMIGIDIRFVVKDYILKAIERGVLIHSSGLTTIRLLPPLIIKKEEVDRTVDVLAEVLK